MVNCTINRIFNCNFILHHDAWGRCTRCNRIVANNIFTWHCIYYVDSCKEKSLSLSSCRSTVSLCGWYVWKEKHLLNQSVIYDTCITGFPRSAYCLAHSTRCYITSICGDRIRYNIERCATARTLRFYFEFTEEAAPYRTSYGISSVATFDKCDCRYRECTGCKV